jgi:hypothetical protein
MRTRNYCERQWSNIELPPDVWVPSMLGPDERRLLFSLARDSFSGTGAIVDAGSFLGGSTLALGAGLRANSGARDQVVLHSYDMFLIDDYMLEHYIDPARDGRRKPGESCRDLFDRNISAIAPMVQVHHGDIRDIGWDGTPIEILFLDIVKSPNTNDRVIADFMPALIPGRSVLVQQDYVQEAHFWIHITMEALHEYFDYVEFVEYSSTIYLLKKAIPRHVLDGCMWNALRDDDKLRLMDNAINRWQGFPKGVIECCRALMRASWFGDRDGALRDLDRIRDAYYWSDHVLNRMEWNRNLVLSMPWNHSRTDRLQLPPEFDAKLYWEIHKDVANAGVNPTLHYLEWGHKEGRRLR